ncbi:MAG: ZIP family metal transporter [Clostridia bacterium]|nr:ZIP family metal transporter [Clostridia bacterium]
MFKLILGVIVPFIGTSLGAFLVFFLKDNISEKFNKMLLGFAAGVMIASSIWSLIIPAVNQSKYMGFWSFFPALCGICIGLLFMLLLDKFCRILTIKAGKFNSYLTQKNTLLFLAVTIHNVPEGMAVGVALASAFYGNFSISIVSALALSIGIAIQNIPEGMIVSLPLVSNKLSKKKAFLFGVLSGIVEPIFAVITILLIRVVAPVLPYLLSFAAGAMIYVSVEELIPESHSEDNSKSATVSFFIGFLIMMILDIVLG